MQNRLLKYLLIVVLSVLSISMYAEIFMVNSLQEFDAAHDSASTNDSIIWESGTYSNIYLEISKSNLYIGAATLGGTIFTGASRARVNGDYIVFEGFQFIGGNIGTNDIIGIYGSHNHFNQLNLRDYTCYKYLRIRESSQYVRVTHCNFENRLNLDDQNILSILVDDTNPGYHKVQYCSFKNFDGTGNDLGIEPIRIGVSTQAKFISRSLVEYCYFTQCNGDGELISNKARQNVFRFNTFENNPLAELVLRHGSESVVYGNFFLNGKGGVRVREGQDHYIYNNYFFGLNDRAIYLQNEASDPLSNIHIAFNTIINCSEIRLGGTGNNKPMNVTFSNNIFANPDESVFRDPTNTETWIGNMVRGNLGMTLPLNGVTLIDLNIEENGAGFWGLSENSPAIDAALPGYSVLPQFEGMEPIDIDISLDLMGQTRPAAIEDKDLGSNEFPHTITIQPIATEANTGPGYNTDVISATNESKSITNNWVQLYPNPVSSHVELRISTKQVANIKIDLLDAQGNKISTLLNERVPAGEENIIRNIDDLSKGTYIIRASRKSANDRLAIFQTLKFVKL